MMRKRLRISIKDEEGSAITEFLILTLPLFLPMVIFLADFSALSNREIQYQSIARQAVRAFVLSANQRQGIADVKFILQETGLAESVDIEITCPDEPCYTPNALVKLSLSKRVSLRTDNGLFNGPNSVNSNSNSNDREVIATVYQRFDQWLSQP